MVEFLSSLHPLGWLAIGLALFALVSLPKALREMWTRPWKAPRESAPSDPYTRPGPHQGAPGGTPPGDAP